MGVKQVFVISCDECGETYYDATTQTLVTDWAQGDGWVYSEVDGEPFWRCADCQEDVDLANARAATVKAAILPSGRPSSASVNSQP